jgi:hypothetical protein
MLLNIDNFTRNGAYQERNVFRDVQRHLLNIEARNSNRALSA